MLLINKRDKTIGFFGDCFTKNYFPYKAKIVNQLGILSYLRVGNESVGVDSTAMIETVASYSIWQEFVFQQLKWQYNRNI